MLIRPYGNVGALQRVTHIASTLHPYTWVSSNGILILGPIGIDGMTCAVSSYPTFHNYITFHTHWDACSQEIPLFDAK